MSLGARKGLTVFLLTMLWLIIGAGLVATVTDVSCPRAMIPVFTLFFLVISWLLLGAIKEPEENWKNEKEKRT